MQSIMRDATDAVDRTIILEAVDSAGAAVDITADTLKLGSLSVSETSLSGHTITQEGGAAHTLTLSKTQSALFAVGEVGYIRIPAASGALESVFPILITEARIADAPPTPAEVLYAQFQALADGLFEQDSTTITLNGVTLTVSRPTALNAPGAIT